jgi:monoamine oxidase
LILLEGVAMLHEGLSRRDLLKSSLLAGLGLSLIEGRSLRGAEAGVTHRPVAEQIERINDLNRGKNRRKVAILGAGLAGLAAAYELLQRKHEVTVFEGSQRIGGRVWTKRFSQAAYHEYGAMRIPASHDYTRYYIAAAGLTPQLRHFVTSYRQLACFLHLRGKVTRIAYAGNDDFYSAAGYRLSDKQNRLVTRSVPPALLGQLLVEEVMLLTESDIASLFGMSPTLTPRARYLSQTSLREFLLSRLCGNRDALELIGATTGLEVWWDKSIDMLIRDEITKNGEGLQQLAGGMETLPKEIAIKLGAKYANQDNPFQVRDPGPFIRLNHRLDCIEAARDKQDQVRLLISTLNQDEVAVPEKAMGSATGQHWETFDHVICTIPFPVLRTMTLTNFSAEKLRAIRSLGYTSSTKVLLHCKERFWEREYGIVGGASFSDGITRATYYPSDNTPSDEKDRPEAFTAPEPPRGPFVPGGSYAPQPLGPDAFRQDGFAVPAVSAEAAERSKQPGVLVASYNWGQDARLMGEMPLYERRAVCTNVIRSFHPEIEDYLVEGDGAASMAWHRHPWTQGAFCFYEPGDLEHYYQDAIRSEGKVHFAGEHCSQDQGWIQGALISALRSVEAVLY